MKSPYEKELMLVSLTVKQFALIEHVHLELGAGMTVFTGETGAGKSMLCGALAAVFGARASADWVRHGAQKSEVTAVWEGADARIDTLLESIDIDGDEALILRRIITRDSRSRAYINGVPVTLKILQKIGEICLDMHGQHEHQSLMQLSVQRQLLDTSVPELLLHHTKASFDSWQKRQSRLKTLNLERGETEQQAIWMRDELARLEELDVSEGLADSLQGMVDAGRHHAQIQQSASEALVLLDEAEPSLRDMLARADYAVSVAEDFHDGLHRSRRLLDQMDTLLSEVTPELRSVLDHPFDEAALLQSEQRLMALHEAMRRHDCDEAGLLKLMDVWRERLDKLDTAGWDEASLTRAMEKSRDSYCQYAKALNAERKLSGEKLTRKLRPFLDRLALAGMQVCFDVQAGKNESDWRASGWDRVSIKIMSNPGEPWRDLAAVASGGEISRLVLAFKGCGVLTEMPHVAVFDEVDTGIGGETAWCVGELLVQMSKDRQVLVISHLPQVASCADHQVVICKSEKEGRTITGLELVKNQSRQVEIARMLGGAEGQTLQHAREMLVRGQTLAL
ncbi:MAG: DNA repair protein RecN [Mariprofundus sp.]|nr:DNA repair protein RecN [Mariprofundus sp.]